MAYGLLIAKDSVYGLNPYVKSDNWNSGLACAPRIPTFLVGRMIVVCRCRKVSRHDMLYCT